MIHLYGQDADFYASFAAELYEKGDLSATCKNLITAFGIDHDKLHLVNLAIVYAQMGSYSSANEILSATFEAYPYETLLFYYVFVLWSEESFYGDADMVKTTIANCLPLFKNETGAFSLNYICQRFEAAFKNLIVYGKYEFNPADFMKYMSSSELCLSASMSLADRVICRNAVDGNAQKKEETSQKENTEPPFDFLSELKKHFDTEDEHFKRKLKDDLPSPVSGKRLAYGEVYLREAERELLVNSDAVASCKAFLEISPEHPEYVGFAERELLKQAIDVPAAREIAVEVCKRVLSVSKKSHFTMTCLAQLILQYKVKTLTAEEFGGYFKAYAECWKDDAAASRTRLAEADEFTPENELYEGSLYRRAFEIIAGFTKFAHNAPLYYLLTSCALQAEPNVEILIFHHALSCKICGFDEEFQNYFDVLTDIFPFSSLTRNLEYVTDGLKFKLKKKDFWGVTALDERCDSVMPGYLFTITDPKNNKLRRTLCENSIEWYYDFRFTHSIFMLPEEDSVDYDRKGFAAYFNAMPLAEKTALLDKFERDMRNANTWARKNEVLCVWLMTLGVKDISLYLRTQNNGFAYLTSDYFMYDGLRSDIAECLFETVLGHLEDAMHLPDIEICKIMFANFKRNFVDKGRKITKTEEEYITIAFDIAYLHKIMGKNFNRYTPPTHLSKKTLDKYIALFEPSSKTPEKDG